MTTDYFEAKNTGGSKDSIEITVEVKTDKVEEFANWIATEVRDGTIDSVLEIISDMQTDIQSQLTITVHSKANIEWACLEEVKEKINALQGGKK